MANITIRRIRGIGDKSRKKRFRKEPVIYTFGFDALGRPTTTQIGSTTIFTQAYNPDGTLLSQSFANGGQVRYGYDSYKRMIGSATEQDSAWRYVYTYGANGELARLTDNNLGRVIHSEYDLTGRPMRKATEGSDGTPIYTGEVSYDDEHGLLASFTERMLDEKYGEGNWTKGEGEYGKIVKWIQRDVFYYEKGD